MTARQAYLAGRRVYAVGWSLYYSRPMALARAFYRGLVGR